MFVKKVINSEILYPYASIYTNPISVKWIHPRLYKVGTTQWCQKTYWERAHKFTKVFAGWQPNGIFTLKFSPDGVTLASGGTDGTILLWDRDEIVQTTDR